MVSSCKILQPNKSAAGAEDFEEIASKGYFAPEGTYMIPNAFTPDSDPPQNFTVYSKDDSTIYILKMKIFNRWGKLIYTDSGLGYWDGTYNGTPVPQDVYIYKMILEFPDGNKQAVKGDVTLLR